MSNVIKYLLALESIDLTPDEKDDLSRIRKNIEILEKYIGSDLEQSIVDELSEASFSDLNDPEWKYSLYVYQLVLSIIGGVKFDSDAKEDLISTKHLNLLIESIQDVSVYGLRTNLHSLFRTHRVFGPVLTKSPASTEHLKISLKVFRKVLAIRELQPAGSLNEVIRDYIAGILSIIESDLVSEIKLTEAERKLYQSDLNAVWKETSKCEYFKNILLFKGLPDLPPALQKRLHSELLNKLMSKGGFANFVTTLLTQRTKADLPETEYFEVVANIVAHKGHSLKFHKCLIDQIFAFLKLCVTNKSMAVCMGAGLLTLGRLYELKNETRDMVTEKVRELFQKLSAPEDVISGLIVMEYSEFVCFCNFLFTCFCSSSVECLPSELLTNFLPLLLSVYSYIPDQFAAKNHIRRAAIRCLANRSRPELQQIVTSLVAKKYPDNWVDLHPRVLIRSNAQFSELTVKITSPEAQLEPLSISNVLPELLISSKHNILTHVVFMCLLSMMQEVLLKNDEEATERRIELLQDEQELITFLNTEYPVKVEIVLCLSALIAHPNLRSQISGNSGEFLDVLRTFIQQRSTQCLSNQESIDHTLLLMLTITQEVIENSDIPEKFRGFSKVLRELLKQTPNELVIYRINKLLELLEGGLKASAQNKASQYNMARDLIKSQETHLKVYGINLMIEMLRRKEKDALGNVHVTLALALHVLKDKESYAFLNCVRLLVALVHVVEAEVLETLSDEYLNKDSKMDYRLLVGEAILKVTMELNQLSYKYKDVLLNCFIHGCRSEVDEFRWSSFSNLATLCRTLTFQVHKFFQEMLILVENEIRTGTYLPARRAAVLVLSELLLGIENLLDHEEYLLPVYRVLKTLSTESDDEKIRIHAANGLKALGDKCKKFLIPDEKLQKEIKILGINDPPSKKSPGHILELN